MRMEKHTYMESSWMNMDDVTWQLLAKPKQNVAETHQEARRLESDAVDLSAGWFEALVGILCRDAGCTAVSSDGRIVHSEEINLGVHSGIHSIELPCLCQGVWKNKCQNRGGSSAIEVEWLSSLHQVDFCWSWCSSSTLKKVFVRCASPFSKTYQTDICSQVQSVNSHQCESTNWFPSCLMSGML